LLEVWEEDDSCEWFVSVLGVSSMMNPMQFLRLQRYTPKKLMDLFNKECEKVKMPDPERKIVFDSQANYLAWATNHLKGIPLQPIRFASLNPEKINLNDAPDYVRKGMREFSRISGKYDERVMERAVGAAHLAIIKVYMAGGVFSNVGAET
jgi:hypothetical protein